MLVAVVLCKRCSPKPLFCRSSVEDILPVPMSLPFAYVVESHHGPNTKLITFSCKCTVFFEKMSSNYPFTKMSVLLGNCTERLSLH